MPNWSASMQQTYEFYVVDPNTWKDTKRLTNIKSCSISRDSESETLGSATFDITGSINECYIRVYLVTIQNGVTEKHPLGTFLTQTPSTSFDGKIHSVSVDAYTPLIELKEKLPPIGYYIRTGEDIMAYACDLMIENMRGPVVGVHTKKYNEDTKETEIIKLDVPSTKLNSNFLADPNETWLTFLTRLVSSGVTTTYHKVEYDNNTFVRTIETIPELPENYTKTQSKTASNEIVYEYTENEETRYFCIIEGITSYKLDLDEMGRVLFSPVRDVDTMVPIWTYTDDNSSILYPELDMDHDLYGIPNVVEVSYTKNNMHLTARVVNDDPNSPTSTVTRGREIQFRQTSPDIHGTPTQSVLETYAKDVLKALSSVEYTVNYTHGYCPVRVGDCVRLNYRRAGLTNIKAKVVNQTISCETGCSVTETAVFTIKLWG
jgi:hypothetical protein